VLRTSPFPGDAIGTGGAACYVTNAGGTSGTVSAILYNNDGTPLKSISGVSLPAHTTTSTEYNDFADSPTHCECVVPSAANYRCSFAYVNKDVPGSTVVIGAPK
jgi:hypothetical protein